MIKDIFLTSCLVILLFGCKTGVTQKEDDYYKMKRKEMVDNQIIARGIKDKKVLDALYKVERHRFISENLKEQAYNDNPLPIGEGQTISQPYIVAIMTELAELKSDEKVLEIGTGSGYQAAILSEMVKEVYTIEIIESLAKGAEKILNELGYKNIKVKCGDGFLGWEEHSTYDAIIVTCAPSKIPEPLLNQLKEGGRLIIPVGDVFQELKRVRKLKGKLKEESIIPVRFVPMTGDEIKKRR